MSALPDDVVAYKRTPSFTAETTPAGLRGEHRTKAGVWGRLVVEAGAVDFRFAGEASRRVEAGGEVVIPPARPHAVDPGDEARFYVEFLRAPAISG